MVEPVFAQQEQPARGALLRAAGMDLGRPPDVLPKARRRRYPIPAEPVRGRRRSGAAGTWRERAAELAVTADGNRAKQIMQRQGEPVLLVAQSGSGPSPGETPPLVCQDASRIAAGLDDCLYAGAEPVCRVSPTHRGRARSARRSRASRTS